MARINIRNMENHDFYCMKCGCKGLNVYRQTGRQHSKFHRKRMYCYYCKKELNFIECRNPDEVAEFHDAFLRGDFADEANESMAHCKGVV